MKEKIAIAVFVAMFALAVWINPGEVLPHTLQVILWCLAAFFAIILLVGLPGIIASTPDAIVRIRYEWRHRKNIRQARRIASAHAKHLAADPASDYIGDLHNNRWHEVRSDFIETTIVPQLGAAARAELANRSSPLSQLIRDIVDHRVHRARM